MYTELQSYFLEHFIEKPILSDEEAIIDHKRMQLAIEELENIHPFKHVLAATGPVWLGDNNGIPLAYSQDYDGAPAKYTESNTFEFKLSEIENINPSNTAVIWNIRVVKKFVVVDTHALQTGVHILPSTYPGMTPYQDLLLRINKEQMQDHAAQGIVYKDNILGMVANFLDGDTEPTTPSEYVVYIRGYGINKRVQNL